jgi:signal transduction histidine kinase
MEKSRTTAYLETTPRPTATEAARTPWSLAEWEFGTVFIGLYLLLERVSFIHPWAGTGITAWNPQTALVLAMFLIRGMRGAPAVFLAMLVSEMLLRTSPLSISLAALCAAIGTLGYAGAGLVLNRQLSARARIRSLRDFAWLLGIMAVTPLLVGTFYVAANASFGMLDWTSYLQGLLHYWIGDVVGTLTLLPLALALHDRKDRRKLAGILTRWETLLQLGAAAAILSLVYVFMPGHNVKYFFLLFLPLIWIAARHGQIGAAMAVAFVQLGLIAVVQMTDTGASTLLDLQARMLGLAVTGLLLGVVVDERERAQERLRQSLRLAAAGEMAAALAHEVNQPLTALVTYGRACQHMLARSPADLEKLEQTVGKLTEQAQRVGAIVKRLRDFLRSGTMNLERMAPGDFLASIRNAFMADAERDHIVLHMNLEPDLPRVMVDRLELEIVLRNLVANAMESIREAGSTRREIVLEARNHGLGTVVMSVIDSGPGIPAEVRERLFTPFSTSKSHGMGLGLAISRAIVTAHGGRLWAEPTAFGSFHLTLPTVTGDSDDIEH